MRANKESAQAVLALLHKHGLKLPEEVFEKLHNFIKSTIPRLPRAATVERWSHGRKKPVSP